MKTPRRVPKPRRKASEKKLQYVSLVCLESNNCFQSSAQKSSNVRLMIMIMRHIINYRNIMKYHCISSTSQYLEQVSFQSHFKTKSHFNHSGWRPFLDPLLVHLATTRWGVASHFPPVHHWSSSPGKEYRLESLGLHHSDIIMS